MHTDEIILETHKVGASKKDDEENCSISRGKSSLLSLSIYGNLCSSCSFISPRSGRERCVEPAFIRGRGFHGDECPK
ncbi:hypothetical protein TNCV_182481 [Trichonephila clavipes]|nr:hypothetical protein TNCV_182481 [Trichonephila clavipes]